MNKILFIYCLAVFTSITFTIILIRSIKMFLWRNSLKNDDYCHYATKEGVPGRVLYYDNLREQFKLYNLLTKEHLWAYPDELYPIDKEKIWIAQNKPKTF